MCLPPDCDPERMHLNRSPNHKPAAVAEATVQFDSIRVGWLCLPRYLPSDYPDLCNVSRSRQSLSGSVLRKLHLTRLDRADRPVERVRERENVGKIIDAFWWQQDCGNGRVFELWNWCLLSCFKGNWNSRIGRTVVVWSLNNKTLSKIPSRYQEENVKRTWQNKQSTIPSHPIDRDFACKI